MVNQAAQELIGVNPNQQDGDPITKALKKLVKNIQEYKTPQQLFCKDNNDNKLVISGVPSLDLNYTIILIYYPELSDIIRPQIDQLKNPSEWDYLLYLETTENGKLINKLIPSSTEQLLNFKIKLLQIALNPKSSLLYIPQEDLIPTVELIHHISLRQKLHILRLQIPEKTNEILIKIFGINPLLNNVDNSGLLSKLEQGTIFIENIDLLALETQNQLADFIIYGSYKTFKGDQKINADVRIICSSNKNIQQLSNEGKFSIKLYNELSKTSLNMPAIISLPKDEIIELIEGFANQAIRTNSLKNFFELNEKEKEKLNKQRAVSLHEFKTAVQQLLLEKSTKHKLQGQAEFDPAYHVTDPDLVYAVKLGKKALKDPKILQMLWDKFKNQNKIATLLSVNRSSVNRRLKDYNIF